MPGDKVRLRFTKTGTLRLLSHHDLMRSFERMLRRADLPFKSTAGFHPGPRVVFALSLPLGVVGREEVVEIEFTRELDAADVLARLRAQAPAGLDFTRATLVPMKATAVPRCVVYRMVLPPESAAPVAARCRELLAEPKVWVDRLRPSPKKLNIRPYLRDLRVTPAGEGHALELDLWVTQTGSARAEELLKLVGVSHLTDEGYLVERTTLEVRDETPEHDPADVPPDGPADTQRLDPAAAAALARREEEQPAAAGWGASPPGPVVE
ncbi:MAG TPA: TIGR03936 family radical SAM-associated protein [Gemmata sp.]|nr:TIGR03936 family radical SAM-associated protein [Gemmata sp.]